MSGHRERFDEALTQIGIQGVTGLVERWADFSRQFRTATLDWDSQMLTYEGDLQTWTAKHDRASRPGRHEQGPEGTEEPLTHAAVVTRRASARLWSAARVQAQTSRSCDGAVPHEQGHSTPTRQGPALSRRDGVCHLGRPGGLASLRRPH